MPCAVVKKYGGPGGVLEFWLWGSVKHWKCIMVVGLLPRCVSLHKQAIGVTCRPTGVQDVTHLTVLPLLQMHGSVRHMIILPAFFSLDCSFYGFHCSVCGQFRVCGVLTLPESLNGNVVLVWHVLMSAP